MAKVTCYIAGRENSAATAKLAGDLVDEIRAPNRQAGVFWLEYFVASDGKAEAQIHFIPDKDVGEVRPNFPELANRT